MFIFTRAVSISIGFLGEGSVSLTDWIGSTGWVISFTAARPSLVKIHTIQPNPRVKAVLKKIPDTVLLKSFEVSYAIFCLHMISRLLASSLAIKNFNP